MPTPITLEAAIAELKRIGPVYDAALRIADQHLASNPDPNGTPQGRRTLLDELAARVKTARPETPALLSGWEKRAQANAAGYPDTDWDDLVPAE